MGITGRAPADKTRLGSDESKMSLVSVPHFLTDRRDHHCCRRLLFLSAYTSVLALYQSVFSHYLRAVRPVLEIGTRRFHHGAISGLYGECIGWR